MKCSCLKLVWCFVILLACETPFSYSPFEARVPASLQQTTEKNLQRIRDLDQISNDTVFNIALISDTHYHFDNLRDALRDIDRKNEAAFIIVTGDITENGLQKEFELFHQIMAKSSKPYLTVIGNHDHLSNGAEAYQQIFGPLNYTFSFNNVSFIMWDDTAWESNRPPDYAWLKDQFTQELQAANQSTKQRIIPFAHIAPEDPQIADSSAFYHDLMVRYGSGISIHGHKHSYTAEQVFGDGVTYVTIGSPQMRAYAMLTVTPQKITVRKIDY